MAAPTSTAGTITATALHHYQGLNYGFASCYARTNEGALLSACNFAALSATEEHQPKAYEHLVVPGPGRDKLLVAVKAGEIEQVPEGARFQIAGFRMDRYTGDWATITLALEDDGRYFAVGMDLQWVDGDWKIVANDDGTTSWGSAEIPNLASFVPWAGA